MTETETPTWIVPGTAVVIISGRGGQRVTRTEIAKVYKRYFTVSSRSYAESRFSLDRQEAHSGDAWSMNPLAVPVGSPRGQEALAATARRVLVNRARSACDEWIRHQTRGNRQAAIAALQAVEGE